MAPNATPVYDCRVESQDERRTKLTIETLRGFALLAVGVILTIWGATQSGGLAVAFVAMGGVVLVGGGGVLFLVRTPRIEDIDRRRALRLWAAGMLGAVGIVATIGGAALSVPAWIALGVVTMVFGGRDRVRSCAATVPPSSFAGSSRQLRRTRSAPPLGEPEDPHLREAADRLRGGSDPPGGTRRHVAGGRARGLAGEDRSA